MRQHLWGKGLILKWKFLHRQKMRYGVPSAGLNPFSKINRKIKITRSIDFWSRRWTWIIIFITSFMVNNESQRSYDESFLPGVHVENWSPRFLYHGIIICEWTGRSFSRIFNMHLLVKHCLIDCRKDYWGYLWFRSTIVLF